MNSFVSFKAGRVLEIFPTCFTGIVCLPCVNFYMLPMGRQLKQFPTCFTDKVPVSFFVWTLRTDPLAADHILAAMNQRTKDDIPARFHSFIQKHKQHGFSQEV